MTRASGWMVAAAATVGLAAMAAPAHADGASDLRALPGLSALGSDLGLTADGSGYRIAIAGTAGVTGVGFSGGAGWHAGLVVPPAAFALDGLGDMGGVTPSAAVLVVASGADTLTTASLPSSLRGPLAAYGASLPVVAGVNVFVSAKIGTDGVLGQLGDAIGGTDVLITGSVGADVFINALRASGSSAAAPGTAGSMSLAVTFAGAVVPPAFRLSTAEMRRAFHVVMTRTTLSVSKSGPTVTFGGALAATVTVRGKDVAITGSIAVARAGSTTTVRLQTAAATSAGIDDLLGVADPSLKLAVSQLGFDATLVRSPAGLAGDLGLAVTVVPPSGRALSGRLGVIASTMAGLQEVNLALRGELPIGNPGGADALVVKDPQVGMLIAAGGGYVSGDVTWRGLRAKGLAWAQVAPVGLAVFLDLGTAKLSRISGGALPTDVELPASLVVLSSVPLDGVPLERMPSIARTMLDKLALKQLTVGQGMALFTSFDVATLVPADGRAELAKAGISGRFVLAGAVKLDGGKPSFDLYADLPTFKLPPLADGKFPMPTLQPRIYLSAVGGVAPSLTLGAEVAFNRWKLDGVSPVDLLARFGITLGAGLPSLKITGKLTSDWVDPLYLKGIKIGKNTGVSFALAPDSARLLMNGNVSFDGLSYGLGGGFALQWATGVPTPKGLALRLSGDELGLAAAASIGQTVMRAGANMITTLVGKTGLPLPDTMIAALVAAKSYDFAGAVRGLVPTSGPIAEIASFALRDVELFLATPGMEDPDFPDLDDVGMKIKGELWRGASRLAAVDTYLTTKLGYQLKVSTASFDLGPLRISDPLLDVGVGIPGIHATLPHFIIAGEGSVKGHHLAALDVHLSASEVSAAGDIDLCGSGDRCIGGKVAMAGAVTGPLSAWFKGSAELNPPKSDGVNVGGFDAAISLDTEAGITFTGSVKFEGARFAIEGDYTSPRDWSMRGEAGVDKGTKRFEVGGVEIIKLSVDSGYIKLRLSDSGASLKAKGKASINPIGLPKFGWDFDQDVTSDLRIHKSVKFEVAGIEKTFTIDYKVFP